MTPERRKELRQLVSKTMADAVLGQAGDADVVASIELMLEELPAGDIDREKLVHLQACRQCRINMARDISLRTLIQTAFPGATVEVVDITDLAQPRPEPPQNWRMN